MGCECCCSVRPDGYSWGCNFTTCSATPINACGMPKKLYTTTERFLSDCMHQLPTEKMIAAEEEEKKPAMARGDFHQGTPAITVVVDDGWSKQSHKHSYNAKSGFAVIFGQCTKKLWFLGVHNKYCAICSVAENQNTPKPHHRCYHNWSASSAAMGNDIIVEGPTFLSARAQWFFSWTKAFHKPTQSPFFVLCPDYLALCAFIESPHDNHSCSKDHSPGDIIAFNALNRQRKSGHSLIIYFLSFLSEGYNFRC